MVFVLIKYARMCIVFPMAGGSNKHMIGLIRVGKDPEWSESKTIAESQGKQVDVRQRTYWEKNVDKQTGSYTKFTGKDKVVSGERFVEKSTSRVGYKDEYEKSSTVKIGDNDGYTEYYCEEKVSRVVYGKNSKNKAITNYPYPKYNKKYNKY